MAAAFDFGGTEEKSFFHEIIIKKYNQLQNAI